MSETRRRGAPASTPRPRATEKRRPSALSPGDTVEYSTTYEVTGGGRKVWLKFGAVSSVREGETDKTATTRLVDFVDGEIEKQIKEITG